MHRRLSPVCRTHAARILLMLGCFAGLSALGGCPPMNVPSGDGGDNGGMTDDTGSGDGAASGGGSDVTGGDAVGGATTGGDASGGDDGDAPGSNNTGGGNDGDTIGGDTGGGGDNGGGDNTGDTGGDTGGGDDDPPPDDPPPGPDPTRMELELIARTGEPVPGQTEGAAFTVFSNPIIDRDGRVAFWAGYESGAGDGGLYVYQDGMVERVLDDNPANTGEVPGGDDGDYFGDFEITADGDAPGFSWGIGDRLIVSAETRGPSRTNGIYRWRASDGAIVRVIEMIQLEAEFPDSRGPGGFVADFFSPYVTDNAVVVFNTRYILVTQSNSFVRGTGIFASNGVETLPVIDSQLSQFGDVPDQGPNALFTNFPSIFTLSPSGDVLLQASYAGGSGDRGVYLYRRSDGRLLRAIDNSGDDAFLGLPSGAVVGSAGEDFDAISIGAGGDIVVDTTLTVAGQMHDTVLIWNGTQWSELSSDDGVPADALLSGVNAAGECLVLADNRPHLVDAAGNSRDLSAVLPAELEGRDIIWQPSGGTINDAGRCLVPYLSVVDGDQTAPGLALWTGEQLLVVVDAALEIPIASISEVLTPSRPESDYVDRSGAFNSRDEIVFRVIESGADGPQSIYIARGLR